jgi:hypothetical protein
VLAVPPLAFFDPLQLPLAVQLVGLLVALQVIVADWPVVMLPGLTVSDTLGTAGITCTDALSMVPPALFEHVRVNW